MILGLLELLVIMFVGAFVISLSTIMIYTAIQERRNQDRYIELELEEIMDQTDFNIATYEAWLNERTQLEG